MSFIEAHRERFGVEPICTALMYEAFDLVLAPGVDRHLQRIDREITSQRA